MVHNLEDSHAVGAEGAGPVVRGQEVTTLGTIQIKAHEVDQEARHHGHHLSPGLLLQLVQSGLLP